MVATRQMMAAVLCHADVPRFRLLKPCPLYSPFRTLLWFRNSVCVQVSRSLSVSSSPTTHVTSWSIYVLAAVVRFLPSCFPNCVKGLFLFRRFHLAVLTSFFESPHCPHSTINQNWKLPCTTSTHAAAHGAQRVLRRPRYSHLRRYQ